ncbi:MAG: flagellar export protein FliJ [Candidatus Velthaea sp.]|jgi:flagellar export protein FliJ
MPARFRFRLDPVLDHRGRIEDTRKRELASAQRARLEAEALRLGFLTERDGLRERLHNEHAALDLDTLRSCYAHLAYLDRAIIAADGRVAAALANEERARGMLLAASKDKKALETVKTRRREAFDADLALTVQRDLDDLNARAFSRSHQQGSFPG